MLEFKKKTDPNTKSGCQQSSLSSKTPGNGTFFSPTEKKNEIFSGGTRKIFKLRLVWGGENWKMICKFKDSELFQYGGGVDLTSTQYLISVLL